MYSSIITNILLISQIVTAIPRDSSSMPESFCSMANLINLVSGEPKMKEVLENYIFSGREHNENIQNEILDIIDEMEIAKDCVDSIGALNYTGHPINAFTLIKRWSKLTPDLLSKLRIKVGKIAPEFINLPLPSTDDLNSAGAAILRLQRIFKLSIESISDGIIEGKKSCHQLNVMDFILLGKIAVIMKDFGLAIQWLDRAITDYTDQDKDILVDIHIKMATAYYEIGDCNKTLEFSAKALNLFPTQLKLALFHKDLKAKCSNTSEHTTSINITTWQPQKKKWQHVFRNLCRGESINKLINLTVNAYKDDFKLTCQLRGINGQSPSYLVYKEEVLNLDPKVVLYHDVMSDEEAGDFTKKAYPMLSTTVLGNITRSAVYGYRLGKVAWLYDLDNHIERISKRIADITGLDTTYENIYPMAEPFHVVNYGFGGQFEPHHDFLKHPSDGQILRHYHRKIGDRIATFMMFLGDIQHGGATVFPYLNLKVEPVKNAALFWYNLKLSGARDRRLLHAGCPVLLGHQWLGSKWIKERGQEFRRKCGLNKDSKDTLDLGLEDATIVNF